MAINVTVIDPHKTYHPADPRFRVPLVWSVYIRLDSGADIFCGTVNDQAEAVRRAEGRHAFYSRTAPCSWYIRATESLDAWSEVCP